MVKNIDDRRREKVLSPWVTLVTHSVCLPGWDSPQDFHSFKQADYVAAFAVGADGRIPLVRQYRSALECYTLELPSGLREPGEDPKQTAARELLEETGFVPGREMTLMGSLAADSGRLENHQWAFFAPDAVQPDNSSWKSEPQVERILVSKQELKRLILNGEFCHSPHLAVIMLALAQGRFVF
jgi:ADP-ribose pyrophosphatase